MDLMCEWVKYFNINLYVPSYSYSAGSRAGKHLHFVYLSSYTFVCTSDFATFHFFPPRSLNPSCAEQWCDSQRFIYHCVPREDMFHPPGRVAVADRLQSVSWLNSGVRGREKERGRDRERERNPFLPSVPTWNAKCIQLLCLTCCIDMKNYEF